MLKGMIFPYENFHIRNLKKMHLLQNINSWTHKNTLAPPLFIEVLVSSHVYSFCFDDLSVGV